MSGLEALGAAAAGLQITEAAVKYSLAALSALSKIKHAPGYIQQAVSDLEELKGLVMHVQSLINNVRHDLPSFTNPQYFEDLIDSLNRETTDWENILQPLRLSSTDDAVQRTWKRVMILIKEEVLLKCTERIARTKTSITTLLTVDIAGELMKAKRTNTSQHQALLQANLNLSSVLSNQIASISQQIASLKDDVTGHVDRSALRVDKKVELLQAANQNLQRVQIDASECARATRADTVALRSSVDQIQQGIALLLSNPGNLADLCNNPQSRRNLFGETSSGRSSRTFRCTCKLQVYQRSQAFGPARFIYESSVNHNFQCPMYALRTQSTATGFTINTWPLLSASVEVLFQTTTGAGGYAFSPTLKYHAVVRRSKTPAFVLFDELWSKLGTRRGGPRRPNPQSHRILGLIDTRAEFTNTIEKVEAMLTVQPALALARDEFNSTLFLVSIFPDFSHAHLSQFPQEIVNLLSRGGDHDLIQHASYEALVEPVLFKLADLGVDVNARDEYFRYTAAQYATHFPRVTDQSHKLTHTLRACGSQESDFRSEWQSVDSAAIPGYNVKLLLRSLCDFPEYADGWSIALR